VRSEKARTLPGATMALAAAIFLYTFLIRIWGIDRHFWLLGDQIRDWAIALGPLGDLPLVGTPQHVGGDALGPVHYWVLWLIRVTIGPWFDNLPHAGGLGLAFLQSMADALLFVAVWRRLGSACLAVAVVVVVASAPYDLALSATIWNPVLATALAKTAMALVLLGWPGSARWKAAVVTAVAWLVVQAHLPGLYLAACILSWLVLRPLLERRRREVGATLLVATAVVLALQMPYFVHRSREAAGQNARSPVASSLDAAVRGAAALRLSDSAASLANAIDLIQVEPWRLTATGWVFALCAGVVLISRRREPDLLAVTVGPVAAALAGFAVWAGEYDHYYYLTLMPAVVLTTGLALHHVTPARWRPGLAAALAAAAILAQPARIRAAAGIHRMPAYEAILRASRHMVARGEPVRAIAAEFLPATSDPTFLYRILGGRVDPEAEWTAVVTPDGAVAYRRTGSPRRP